MSHHRLLGVACAALVGSGLAGAALAGAADAAVEDFPAPAPQFSNTDLQSELGNPYLNAVRNVEVINTVAADPSIYTAQA